jgi:hypothetical protein
MDYRARFYSPGLGRFTQPDSVVAQPGNPQSLNRYSYAYNSPIQYVDPSGHIPNPTICADYSFCRPKPSKKGFVPGLVRYSSDEGVDIDSEDVDAINQAAEDVANALADEHNSHVNTHRLELLTGAGEDVSSIPEIVPISARTAFWQVFGGQINVHFSSESCDSNCYAEVKTPADGERYINVYSNSHGKVSTRLIVHEIGHIFDGRAGWARNDVPNALLRDTQDGFDENGDPTSVILHVDANGGNYGYNGGGMEWQFGYSPASRNGEEFADMFVGWVYGSSFNMNQFIGSFMN